MEVEGMFSGAEPEENDTEMDELLALGATVKDDVTEEKVEVVANGKLVGFSLEVGTVTGSDELRKLEVGSEDDSGFADVGVGCGAKEVLELLKVRELREGGSTTVKDELLGEGKLTTLEGRLLSLLEFGPLLAESSEPLLENWLAGTERDESSFGKPEESSAACQLIMHTTRLK
ncbi:hypothetical protein BC835DRAFT_64235 [Cytidiella melzeri]|nr:hypothetical protein BC835DRAFT_64235 [Cytidiella melzeri]